MWRSANRCGGACKEPFLLGIEPRWAAGYNDFSNAWSVTVRYLPPFEALKSFMAVDLKNGKPCLSCSQDDFVTIIRQMIAAIQVDEQWYLERYPDIAEAIENGIIASAQQHFIDDGYFEGRQPFPIRVNERWYLMNNTGVADFVRQGKLESGQQHFEENGYMEGRLPFAL